MYLIVGLGNPGRKYDGTKHNMGFDVIDELVDRHHIPSSGTDRKGMYGKGIIEGQKVILMKPLTYMNLSGEAIRAYVDFYKIDPESELLVIYDDISLDPGNIRIRKKGSAGGHNGMKNIILHLGTDKFPRIRVGVGEKPAEWDLADFVLAPFSKDDRKKVDEAIADAATAVELFLKDDLDGAMNQFNKKGESEAKAAKKAAKAAARAAREAEKAKQREEAAKAEGIAKATSAAGISGGAVEPAFAEESSEGTGKAIQTETEGNA